MQLYRLIDFVLSKSALVGKERKEIAKGQHLPSLGRTWLVWYRRPLTHHCIYQILFFGFVRVAPKQLVPVPCRYLEGRREMEFEFLL